MVLKTKFEILLLRSVVWRLMKALLRFLFKNFRRTGNYEKPRAVTTHNTPPPPFPANDYGK